MEEGHKKTRNQVRVVVVGAGIAGLSTVRHLLQAGFDNVTILEASNRVGGRIRTVRPDEGEGVVELGATYIHGASDDNPVYRLACDWGMDKSLVPVPSIGGQYYQENGETIDKQIVEQVWKLYLDMEATMDSTVQCRKTTETIQNQTNMTEFIKEARPQILQQFDQGEKREAAGKVLNSMLNFCQFMNGDRLHKVSADLCGYYRTFPGPDVSFTGNGYKGFVEKMQETFPDETIHFKSEVVKISWGGSQVEIVCKNDRKYTADHVVVTCSLGHLKANHKHMFHPALPEAKAGAIDRTGFGRVNKLVLCYDHPFWTEGIKLAWSSHGQPIREKSDWLRDLVGFDKVPTNSKAIGGPFSGEGAEVIESLSDVEVADHCTEHLRNIMKDPTIPLPRQVLRSRWISDPLFRGSYSYLSQVNEDGDTGRLADPLPHPGQPRLLFAGEHTHPDFYSTVHGAFLTGLRESQRLADFYKQ